MNKEDLTNLKNHFTKFHQGMPEIAKFIDNNCQGDLFVRDLQLKTAKIQDRFDPVTVWPEALSELKTFKGNLTLITPSNLYNLPHYIRRFDKDVSLIRCSDLKSLPLNLEYVGGKLHLEYTGITSLPENLKYIGGDLEFHIHASNIHTKPIRNLPDDLTIEGSFKCFDGYNITTLPSNLKVKQNFICRRGGKGFVSLPDDIKIGGNIDLEDSMYFKEFPSHLTRVNGHLNLNKTKIEKLPDNLYVDGHLALCTSDIKVFPKNLKVKGDIKAYSTHIKLDTTCIPYYIEVGGKFEHYAITDEQFKEYMVELKKWKDLEQKLPELEGIF